MILAHHGGELPAAVTTLVATGTPLLVIVTARLEAIRQRLRRK